MKRVLSIAMIVVICCSILAGCGIGGDKTAESDDRIILPIAPFYSKNDNPEAYARSQEAIKKFEELYPQYKIEPISYNYDLSTFLPKAAANDLPICFDVAFTEVKRIVDSGYAADVSKFLDKYGYTENVKDEIWDLITYKDTRAFMPISTYTESLYINKKLFEQAGLVNEDGTVKIPDTYDQMLEYAKIIKDKTGKYGYAIPTTNRQGGWAFMNIAWSYGTEFMKQDEDGRWIATFDSPECEEALNVLKRARFEYDVVPPNVLLNPEDLLKLFAGDQLAMFIIPPPQDALKVTYGMDENNIIVAKLPKGPEGRNTLLGGTLLAFCSGYTDEQYEGAFLWQEFSGRGPTTNDERIAQKEDEIKTQVSNNSIVGIPEYTFWKDSVEHVKLYRELTDKYATINLDNVQSYLDTSDVIIKPEEPTNCQQLYEVLDTCIQKVYASEDSDVKKILKEGCEFMQKNYLDKSN